MLALVAQAPEGFLAVDRFDTAALQVVIPAVERLSDRGQLFQVPGQRVLYKLIRRAPVVAERSFSFLAVSGLTWTSMRPLYGFRPCPASNQAA